MPWLLDRVLDPANLRRAWNEVAENKGMAGVDNVSIRRWRRRWEERLIALSRAVRTNRYKPARLRVRRIPKKRPGEWRVLRIPTVTDRVLQRAVMQVLQPLLEPWFLDCSFGYRPGRGLKGAVQRILDLRQGGREWVLDADIDACFDSIDHDLLLSRLREDVRDPLVLRLIEAWLKAGRPRRHEARGISMGSPLSPLLANLYLHRLDQAMQVRRRDIVRYADDFIVLTVTHRRVLEVYREVEAVLVELKLHYEPHKTRIASFEGGFEFLGVRFHRDTYRYTWRDKEIAVSGDRVDRLFDPYGPRY